MKVKVNYEVAEKIVSIIQSNQYKNWSEFETEISKIENFDGIKLMIDFYGELTFDLYKKVLFRALNKMGSDSDTEFVNMLYPLLARIIDEKDKLILKLKSIKKYDFTVLERRLKETLPANTELDIEIFFVLDGINAGSIVGENKMMLNTLAWPSCEENNKIIEGLLLHEYHHLGLLKWIRKYDNKFDAYVDGLGMAKYMMISILSEGAATYFFNEGDDLYPLIVESHGEEMANQYRESMSNRAGNIKTNIEILEKDLEYLINYKGDLSDIREIGNKYFFSSQAEPLDKAIGYHMCSQIVENMGSNALINCFVNPNEFIKTYNKAIDGNESYKIKDDLENIWGKGR